MKYFYINDRLQFETVSKLIDFFNENNDEKVTIYLQSCGGEVRCTWLILDLIKSRKNNVKLVATHEISSAAFALFFLAECEREILPDTDGLWHSGSTSISLDHRKKGVYTIDEHVLKVMPKREKVNTLNICKLVGMDDKTIKKIMMGKDVWFDTEQLNQFLRYTQNDRNS